MRFIKSFLLKQKFWFVLFILFCLVENNAKALEFECDENIELNKIIDVNFKKAADTLYQEVITYLEGFIELLTEKDEACDKWAMIDIAGKGYSSNECLESKDDVVKVINQSKIVLNNKEKFRSCFDLQRSFKEVSLYTPNEEIKSKSFVANYIDRPLLSSFYSKNLNNLEEPVQKAGVRAMQQFLPILEDIDANPDLKRLSYLGLPNLWSSVGWVPMYSSRKSALNQTFRGYYSYGEVIGPYGLLRIQSIEGVPFNLELGMTFQNSNSFYPYHFHHSQEIYIDISNKKCLEKNGAYAAKWDMQSNKKNKIKNGYQIKIPKNKNWRDDFESPKSGEIMYFDRNDIHAFRSNNTCRDNSPGLVSIWARTAAREFDQTTGVCQLSNKFSKLATDPAKPQESYYCNISDLHEAHQIEFD